MKKNIFLHDKKYLFSWNEIQDNKYHFSKIRQTKPSLIIYNT